MPEFETPMLLRNIQSLGNQLRWVCIDWGRLYIRLSLYDFFFCHRKCCFIAKESSLITLVRCEHACCFCFITLFILLFCCTVVVAIPWYVSLPCSCCFSLHYCYWITDTFFHSITIVVFASSHYRWCCLIALVVASCTCCYIASPFFPFLLYQFRLLFLFFCFASSGCNYYYCFITNCSCFFGVIRFASSASPIKSVVRFFSTIIVLKKLFLTN